MLMTTLAAGTLGGNSFRVVHSLAMFQTQDSINSGNSKLLMIFVACSAIALLAGGGALVAMAVVVVKAKNEMMQHVAELKAKILPLVDKSHSLVADLTPEIKSITTKVHGLVEDLTPKINDITSKVQVITGHVEEMTGVAKNKVNEFSPTISAANETVRQTNETVRATVKDANDKTRAQVDRVNGMITGALDATVSFGKAIQHGITQPGRELAGMVSGAKATFEKLMQKYGGLLNFTGKGKARTSPPVRRPVLPYPPTSMGTASTGSAGEYERGPKPSSNL